MFLCYLHLETLYSWAILINNFAITLCGSASETCVLMEWPEKCNRLHWPIKDPESEEDFRNARDEIKSRIDDFLTNV